MCSCLQALPPCYREWLPGAVEETLVGVMEGEEELSCVRYVEALMENFPVGESVLMRLVPRGVSLLPPSPCITTITITTITITTITITTITITITIIIVTISAITYDDYNKIFSLSSCSYEFLF